MFVARIRLDPGAQREATTTAVRSLIGWLCVMGEAVFSVLGCVTPSMLVVTLCSFSFS